jgi:hypothetical protein
MVIDHQILAARMTFLARPLTPHSIPPNGRHVRDTPD